jgi:hypothetical protein
MVAAGTSTTPLENDGEFGVECDMFDASLSQPINDLDSFLGTCNARGDTETLDRQPLLSHFLPQGQLERELTWIDIKRVESDPDARWNLGLDFGDFGANGIGTVVATTGKLDKPRG